MSGTDLEILVRVRDATRAGFETARRGLRSLDSQVGRTQVSFRGLYAQIAGIASVLGAGAFLKSSIRTFTEFDDTMRQVGAVTGATREELTLLTETAKKMGATTRYTASQAADGLRLLGMAGFSAAEATEALPDVLNLAAAGSLDMATSADIATNVLAGFGLEVENLAQVNNVLVKTFTSSNTTLTELGEGFKLVGPIAKGLGADFEDLVGAIGQLGNAGLKGTLAGTALRGALNALFNPTKEEEKLMADLSKRIGGVGLQIKDTEGNFVGFAKVIKQLEDAGLSGDEALKLFGQRAGPGMAALLQVGSEELLRFIEGLRKTGDISDEISDKMESGIGGATRRTKSAFEALKIAMAGLLEKDTIDVLDQIRDAFLNIAKVVENPEFVKSMDRIAKFVKGLVWLTTAWADEQLRVNAEVKNAANYYDTQISITERAIERIQGKINKTQQDMLGWRSKIIGSEVYQKQLEKYQSQLDQTKQKLEELKDQRLQLTISVSEDAARKSAKEFGDVFIKELESGPIGRGTDKTGNAIDKAIKALTDTPELTSKLKAGLTILEQTLKTEAEKIEGEYDRGLVSLDEYYSQRELIIKKKIEAELELLRQVALEQTDINKITEANAKITAKQEELNTKLIQLANDRAEEEKRIATKLQTKQEELARKQLAAERAITDQKARLAIFSQGTGLEGTFQKELADLQTKQAAELQKLQEYHAAQLDLLKERKAAELEVERLYEQQKQEIQNQSQLQQAEKAKLIQDQERRLAIYRLNNVAETAASVSQLFEQLYEISGQKSKEFFYLSKAAAIGQATMSLAAAIMKVYEQEGAFGFANAAEILSKGTALLATISSQSLSGGGIVEGRSPSSTADDKLINATSGEYMHNVAATNYLGRDAMDIINKRAFDRSAVRGALGLDPVNFSIPPINRRLSRFATGGEVASPASMGGGGLSMKVEIVNQSGNELEATQTETNYDSNMRQYIVGVVIDAKNRNVGGINNHMK